MRNINRKQLGSQAISMANQVRSEEPGDPALLLTPVVGVLPYLSQIQRPVEGEVVTQSKHHSHALSRKRVNPGYAT